MNDNITEQPSTFLHLKRRDFLKITSLGLLSPLTPLLQIFTPEIYLETRVLTPASLMLHRVNKPLLKDLAPLLAKEFRPLTYQKLYEELYLGKSSKKLQQKPGLLLSIDDLEVSWLDNDYKEMVDTLTKQGVVGTLGVVTRGGLEDEKPKIWKFLKDCQNKGWEIAIHTEDHSDLAAMSERWLRYEIGQSLDDITRGTGIKPITLILPYGSGDNKDDTSVTPLIRKICKDLGIIWIVGIRGGKTFTGNPPFYVGRISPTASGDSQTNTINLLKNSFIEKK